MADSETTIVFVRKSPTFEARTWNGSGSTEVRAAALSIGIDPDAQVLVDWSGTDCADRLVKDIPRSRIFVMEDGDQGFVSENLLRFFDGLTAKSGEQLWVRFTQPGILPATAAIAIFATYALSLFFTAGTHWAASIAVIELVSATVIGIAAYRHLATGGLILSAIIAVGIFLGVLLVRTMATTTFLAGVLLLTPIPFIWCVLRDSIRHQIERRVIATATLLTIALALALRDLQVNPNRYWVAGLVALSNLSWVIIAVRQGLSDRSFLKAWHSED